MAFGSNRYFKTLREAKKFIKKAHEKGYFVSAPEKLKNGMYWVSVLTRKGKLPLYMRGL